MNYLDWLIIYLSCGAPLGIFYFLQNRRKEISRRLWLKTFFTFICWLPFGFQLLRQNKAGKRFLAAENLLSKIGKTENEIFSFQKQFEAVFRENDSPISLFEFREVFERYVGLTAADNCKDRRLAESKKELFQIMNDKNSEIGAICLNRRNLKRLTFHQIQARRDFFQIIEQLAIVASDRKKFINSAAGFFRLLQDAEAQSALEKMSSDNLPNERNFAAKHPENQLWNTEIRQPPPAAAALQLPSLTAATNLSAKD